MCVACLPKVYLHTTFQKVTLTHLTEVIELDGGIQPPSQLGKVLEVGHMHGERPQVSRPRDKGSPNLYP